MGEMCPNKEGGEPVGLHSDFFNGKEPRKYGKPNGHARKKG